MRKRADVRSQSNRHTGCELFAKFLRMQVEQFLFALRSVRSHSVGGEVFRDGKRGYREYVLLPHQPHGLIAELECVINGHDPSLRRIQRPRLAGRISRSAVKPAIRSSRAARVAMIVRCGTDS